MGAQVGGLFQETDEALEAGCDGCGSFVPGVDLLKIPAFQKIFFGPDQAA